jgi:mannose-6-phosphate isomerase-like protein (cupin superfamily)
MLRGSIEIDGAQTPVQPGSFIFAPERAQHRFVDYADGLTLLVLFAPAQKRPSPGEVDWSI